MKGKGSVTWGVAEAREWTVNEVRSSHDPYLPSKNTRNNLAFIAPNLNEFITPRFQRGPQTLIRRARAPKWQSEGQVKAFWAISSIKRWTGMKRFPQIYMFDEMYFFSDFMRNNILKLETCIFFSRKVFQLSDPKFPSVSHLQKRIPGANRGRLGVGWV